MTAQIIVFHQHWHRSKENLKALERFNEEKATETAWQIRDAITVTKGPIGRCYDYTHPLSSIRQDLEIIAMDFVERIMDATEKHDDKR